MVNTSFVGAPKPGLAPMMLVHAGPSLWYLFPTPSPCLGSESLAKKPSLFCSLGRTSASLCQSAKHPHPCELFYGSSSNKACVIHFLSDHSGGGHQLKKSREARWPFCSDPQQHSLVMD